MLISCIACLPFILSPSVEEFDAFYQEGFLTDVQLYNVTAINQTYYDDGINILNLSPTRVRCSENPFNCISFEIPKIEAFGYDVVSVRIEYYVFNFWGIKTQIRLENYSSNYPPELGVFKQYAGKPSLYTDENFNLAGGMSFWGNDTSDWPEWVSGPIPAQVENSLTASYSFLNINNINWTYTGNAWVSEPLTDLDPKGIAGTWEFNVGADIEDNFHGNDTWTLKIYTGYSPEQFNEGPNPPDTSAIWPMVNTGYQVFILESPHDEYSLSTISPTVDLTNEVTAIGATPNDDTEEFGEDNLVYYNFNELNCKPMPKAVFDPLTQSMTNTRTKYGIKVVYVVEYQGAN